MLLEKDLKKLFSRLIHEDVVQIPCGNNDLTLRVVDQASKVLLSTPVYFGGNFIPSSVRKCVSQKHPFRDDSMIKTSISIDEDQFKIHLSYLDDMENLNTHNFTDIIEKFSELAEKWRLVLDENDRNDLVYIHAKH
jgi:hypothetical protein